MTLYRLVHSIYEPEGAGMRYPILQHVFIGKTREEAIGYFDAHRKTDAFLRGCEERGRWQAVKCVTTLHWERASV